MAIGLTLRSLAYFLLASLFEIGGGYMIWKSLKDGMPMWIGLLGGIILALYGVIATFQTATFGRTYAAYGGIFIIMSLLWGWLVGKIKPDTYDILGAIIVIAGTAVIFYAPRKG
jgi:small multidrug resistance family-3 protein